MLNPKLSPQFHFISQAQTGDSLLTVSRQMPKHSFDQDKEKIYSIASQYAEKCLKEESRVFIVNTSQE